jgi:hypothetical protein
MLGVTSEGNAGEELCLNMDCNLSNIRVEVKALVADLQLMSSGASSVKKLIL